MYIYVHISVYNICMCCVYKCVICECVYKCVYNVCVCVGSQQVREIYHLNLASQGMRGSEAKFRFKSHPHRQGEVPWPCMITCLCIAEWQTGLASRRQRAHQQGVICCLQAPGTHRDCSRSGRPKCNDSYNKHVPNPGARELGAGHWPPAQKSKKTRPERSPRLLRNGKKG